MATVPDDAGQVVAVVEGAGVDRRPAVAQQQCANPAFGLGLLDALVEVVDRAMRAEADMTVRVDEPGHDPTAVEDGLRIGDRFGAQ